MHERFFLAVILLISFVFDSVRGQSIQPEPERCRPVFVDYLRGNFDDIHDVSMRFHHQDPALNGLISFDLTWRDGRLVSCLVVENETGSPAFAGALVKAMEGWHVTGMESACEFPFSFRIKIVGSDDPTFPEKAIFTGFISDIKGRPVGNARISLAGVSGDDPAMPDGRSNREGIFVRTLIPPGSWNVRISCPGYADFVLDEMDFRAGEHQRIEAVLEELPES